MTNYNFDGNIMTGKQAYSALSNYVKNTCGLSGNTLKELVAGVIREEIRETVLRWLRTHEAKVVLGMTTASPYRTYDDFSKAYSRAIEQAMHDMASQFIKDLNLTVSIGNKEK